MTVMQPEVILLDDDDSDDVQIIGFSVCKSASTSREPSHEPYREINGGLTHDFSPPSPTKQAHKTPWADAQNSSGL